MQTVKIHLIWKNTLLTEIEFFTAPKELKKPEHVFLEEIGEATTILNMKQSFLRRLNTLAEDEKIFHSNLLYPEYSTRQGVFRRRCKRSRKNKNKRRLRNDKCLSIKYKV